MTPPGGWRGRLLRVAALVVVCALLVVAARRIDLSRAAHAILAVHPWWIAAALGCYLLILPCWAAQWWLLAPSDRPRRLTRLLGVVAMTASVLNTTPLLVGEAAGVYFLSTYGGIDRAASVGVLAMDQLLVGLAKLCVLGAAAALLPLPPVMHDGLIALGVGVLVLLLLLTVLARDEGLGHRLLRAGTRGLPGRLPAVIERVRGALAPLRSPSRAGGAFALALLKKLCEVAAILCVQRAFDVALPAASALLVLAALNLATLLPIVPGNAGVFEAAVVLAYGWLGVPAERALGMAVVQHAAYFVALALPGYAWLLGAVPEARRAATAYSATCSRTTSGQS